MPRALLSVTDKTGLSFFASDLAQLDFELVSTGGTAQSLQESGLPVKEVSQITGFPEILGGRVKTLHPLIHSGILGDPTLPEHAQQMAEIGSEPFQVVCVNLYAFEKTIAVPHDLQEAIESIDIGGPALIRAAAKNYSNVWIVVDPEDYKWVAKALQGDLASKESLKLRAQLAAKAFRHTAFYDSIIARYLSGIFEGDFFPEKWTLGLKRAKMLRYGENPHQAGALYLDPLQFGGIARAEQIWGKELSYNNLLDAEAAWGLACDLPEGSCAIIKHGNPCGVGVKPVISESFKLAKASDSISAFGGIAAIHGTLDLPAAEAMTEKGNFLEVIIAHGFAEGVPEVFEKKQGWGQSVRLLKCLPVEERFFEARSIGGGALVQQKDLLGKRDEWKVVTKLQPSPEHLEALNLVWTVTKHVKSNAIVVGDSEQIFGVGAGQMNRVHSVRLALTQAGDHARGAVLASDAFFPFPDSIEVAAQAGIAAVIQPGGSKKDEEVIATTEGLGLIMIFTGVRHFRH